MNPNDPNQTQVFPNAASNATIASDPNRTRQVGQATLMGGATVALPYGAAPSAPGQGSADSLRLSVRVGNRIAYAGERTRAFVMTEVTAGGASSGMATTGRRMPVNIALVIDRSGSMEGEPLDYVKRACAFVVDMLTPDDVLSIVTFEETVEVVMPARRVTQPDLIKQHIARIASGNTTNLFDGLYAGGAQAASVPQDGYVTRVLLLTDGEPTAGLKDFTSIVNQVGELKARGVTVTALGFGPEYNEELMAGIARKSGGNYYHIQRPELIPDVFRQEMEQVLGVSAKNPTLTLHLPRGCTVRQAYGAPVNFGPRTAEIALPDIERGATVTKLWEMDWDARTPGMFRVAKATLAWDDTTTGRRETASANAVVEFVADASGVASGADPIVAQAVQTAQAARDIEKTMMAMRTQQISVAQATQAIEKTQMFLAQGGHAEEAAKLGQAANSVRSGDTGGAAEKTLIGAIYDLDLGKQRR